MTRLVVAAALAAAVALPAAAHATDHCVYVPNGDGRPAYVCYDPSKPRCVHGWLGEEAGLVIGDCS